MKKIPVLVFAAIISFFACGFNTARAEIAYGAGSAPITLMAFGDSLTAGLGLPLQDAFPAQLETELKAKGYDVKVINAGVSGETTSGAFTRLDWTLTQNNPDAVILETGANDMLRAVPLAVTQQNLDRILNTLAMRKIPVLLTGMRAFSNLGKDYDAAYEKIFRHAAEKYHVLFYPFFLDGVAFHQDLLQYDGLHPNKQGVAVETDKMLPDVEKLIAQVKRK